MRCSCDEVHLRMPSSVLHLGGRILILRRLCETLGLLAKYFKIVMYCLGCLTHHV
jgi:hypothetical protein